MTDGTSDTPRLRTMRVLRTDWLVLRRIQVQREAKTSGKVTLHGLMHEAVQLLEAKQK